MKKKVLFCALLAAIVLSGIFLITRNVKRVDLNFATTITVNYAYGKDNIKISESDMAQFIDICKGRAVNHLFTPSCSFGGVEMIFRGKNKTVTIYPACDGCATIRYGTDNKLFYEISNENREQLVSILQKYGVNFPCV